MSKKAKKRPHNYDSEIERADDNTFQTVSSYILPNAGEFLISFPKNQNLPKKKMMTQTSKK